MSGDHVYEQGAAPTDFYFIHVGVLKLQWVNHHGVTFDVAVAEGGEVTGLLGLMSDAFHLMNAVPRTHCEMMKMANEDYHHLIARKKGIGLERFVKAKAKDALKKLCRVIMIHKDTRTNINQEDVRSEYKNWDQLL